MDPPTYTTSRDVNEVLVVFSSYRGHGLLAAAPGVVDGGTPANQSDHGLASESLAGWPVLWAGGSGSDDQLRELAQARVQAVALGAQHLGAFFGIGDAGERTLRPFGYASVDGMP